MSPDDASYPLNDPTTPTSPPPPSAKTPDDRLPTELLQSIFTHCHPGHLWLYVRPACRKFRRIIEDHPTRFLTSENTNIRFDVFSIVPHAERRRRGGLGMEIRSRYVPFSKYVRDTIKGDVITFEAVLKVAMPYASSLRTANSVLSTWEGLKGWIVERHGVLSMEEVDEMPPPLERVTDIVNGEPVWAAYTLRPREAEVRVVYEIRAERFFPPLGYGVGRGCGFFDISEVKVGRVGKGKEEAKESNGGGWGQV